MEEDYYKIMAGLQACHWWYEGRRRILSAVIARLDLPPDAAIIEAGCGPGANLPALQAFGAVSAFDMNDYAVEEARKSGAAVEKGVLPDGIPFAEKFDLVGAFDVIEHIDDDLTSVKVLYEKTKPGGYALFTVPAFQFLWSRHDEINHHKRRYRKAQFRDVLQRAGYEVRFISYYNSWLFPLAVAVRYLKKLTGREDEGDVQMPGSDFVNNMLCAVFSSERFLLGRVPLPFGLSIIALCRRPEES